MASPRKKDDKFYGWRLPLVAGMAALSLLSVPASAQEAAKNGANGEKPMLVLVDAARTDSMNQTSPVLGRLVPLQSGPVAARIGGPVGEMLVQVGDRVAADQVIARLVPDSFEWKVELQKAKVAQAAAAINSTKAQTALLTQELERIQGLQKSAAFSQARLDDKRQEHARARSATAEAEAALLSAKAELRLAEIDLYNAEIRAPYDGVVSLRHAEVGAYVTAGSPVITLLSDQDLEIEADVPSEHAGLLAPGTGVDFRLDRGEPFKASVRAIILDENPLTRTRRVRFTPDFPEGLGDLAVNQSVVLEVPAGSGREAVTVDKDAVVNRRGQTMVFVAADGLAHIRPVALADAIGNRFVVTDGLKSGELVVVRGNERLRPGQPVTFDGGTPGQ